jgi:hypothetical protein
VCTFPPCWNGCQIISRHCYSGLCPHRLRRPTYLQYTAASCCRSQNGGHSIYTSGFLAVDGEYICQCHLPECTRRSPRSLCPITTVCCPAATVCCPQQYAAPPPQQYSAPPPQSYTASTIPTSAGPLPEQKCHFDGCPRMIRDCPGTADYINCGLCKRDLTNNWIVLPNNGWIPCWTTVIIQTLNKPRNTPRTSIM